MHEEMSNKPDLKDLCSIEKQLQTALSTVVSNGIFSDKVCGKELGELTDMIKDLAETKKYCWEAHYYETVCKAMEDYDGGDYMGYNSNRYASGRYAPSGTGNLTRSGFTPETMIHQEKPKGWLGVLESQSYGYDLSDHERLMHGPYGTAYREYEDARKHYTETKSSEDKDHMNRKALEHMNNSVMTIKDIWKDADTTLRKEMKSSLTALVSDMPV